MSESHIPQPDQASQIGATQVNPRLRPTQRKAQPVAYAPKQGASVQDTRMSQLPPVAPRGYAGPDSAEVAQVHVRQAHNHTGVMRFILAVVGMICRVAAIVLACLVVVNSFSPSYRLTIMTLTNAVASLLPKALAGTHVIDTPLGGVFRGDFAVASVVLFIVDWICARVRYTLRA